MKKQIGGLNSLALAVALSVAFQNSHALGLGELSVDSTLGEPLSAHIPFTSLTSKEKKKLAVGLAPRKDFEAAGLEYPAFLSKLHVRVEDKGRVKQVILTTEKPLREPVVQLLLKVDWAEGRLVREYTALLDPPIFKNNSKYARPVPAVVTRTAKKKPAAPRNVPVQARPSSVQPKPSVASTSINQDIPDTYGPVRKGDSLWRIAEAAYGVTDVRLLQAMEALLEANPDAFIKHNVHGLMAGVTLKLPPLSEVTRITPKQAYKKFVAQTEQWKSMVQASAGEAAKPAQSSASNSVKKPDTANSAQAKQQTPAKKPGESENKLEIIVADSKPVSGAAAPEGSVQNGGSTELKKRVAVLEEALASKESESSELLQRVKLLEEQLNKARQLIQVQNAELSRIQAQMQAKIQNQAGAAGQQSGAAVEAPAVAATQPDNSAASDNQPVANEAADTQKTDSGSAQNEEPVTAVAPAVSQPEKGVTPADTSTTPEASAEGVDQQSGKISDRPMFEEHQQEKQQAAATAETIDDAENPAENAVRPRVVAGGTGDQQGGTSFLDKAKDTFASISSGSYFLPLLGGLALGGLGLLFVRRRRSVAEFEESILATSTFETRSDLGASIDETTAETTFLNDFGDEGDQTGLEDVDPITEAEVYLAYGRVDQAAEILEDAVKKEPERLVLKLKLLEVYAQKDDAKSFETLAEEIYSVSGDDPSVWGKVSEMGRKLSPGNPMFAAAVTEKPADSVEVEEKPVSPPVSQFASGDGASNEAAVQIAEEDQITGSKKPQSSPFEGLEMGEEATEKPEVSSMPSNPLDVAAPDDSMEFSPLQSQPLEDVAAMDESPSMETGVEPGMETIEPVAPVRENTPREQQPEPAPVETSAAAPLDSLDFDTEIPVFNDFSDDALPEGILGKDNANSSEWDENTTKLDLAKAYIDMGDGDGARSILGEVLNQGTEEQKKQAAELMEQAG